MSTTRTSCQTSQRKVGSELPLPTRTPRVPRPLSPLDRLSRRDVRSRHLVKHDVPTREILRSQGRKTWLQEPETDSRRTVRPPTFPPRRGQETLSVKRSLPLWAPNSRSFHSTRPVSSWILPAKSHENNQKITQ